MKLSTPVTIARKSLLAGTVAMTLGFGSVTANAAEFINILTGGTSGVYYPLGVGLSKIYADNMEDVRTQVQSTKASVENLNLLQKGRGELALALGDSVKNAWEGNEEVGFPKKLDKLRGIAAVYPNFIQIVASKESGIKTFADLKGKSLSVGAAKSGTELNARTIFGAAGMSYDDLGKTEYLPFSESVELIKNRQLDATLQEDVVEKLGPPYISAAIPAGTYDGQDEDVTTVAVVNFLVTHSEVSDETAYQMTKLLFENLPALEAAHKAAASIKLENALKGMPVPLHPGAERFYKEKGLL